MVQHLHAIFVSFGARKSSSELQEDGHKGVLGDTISYDRLGEYNIYSRSSVTIRINFQSPCQSSDTQRLAVYDAASVSGGVEVVHVEKGSMKLGNNFGLELVGYGLKREVRDGLELDLSPLSPSAPPRTRRNRVQTYLFCHLLQLVALANQFTAGTH